METETDTLVAMAEVIPITLSMADKQFPPMESTTFTTNALFLRSYLVMLTGLSEDIPVGLFEQAEEAVEFARDVHTDPDAHAGRYYAALNLTKDPEHCRWIAISILEFSGPVPMCRTVLFEF